MNQIRRTRIKVCGTTNSADAIRAVECGVDALGFIFVEKSSRYISPQEAVKITSTLPPFLYKIGVFVDADMKEVFEIVHYLGLNGVQLHGKESPDYCEQLSISLPSCTQLKAFRVGEHSTPEEFTYYEKMVDGFLLDTYVKDIEGGTGLSFDWSLIEGLNLQKPYILAGGLNPDNISQALEITSPFAVDVNSGIELAPGRKDHALLQRFVYQVIECDRKLSNPKIS